MHFIDTHIHLQDYKENCATDIIRAAAAAGVRKFFCVSAVEKDWERVAALYERFSETVVPAFGIHPWYASEVTANWETRLQKYLETYPVALVGECGLDRLRSPEFEPQSSVFDCQISLAKDYKRPLLIHAVKAQDWLEAYWQKLPQPFVFHSYNGKAELLKKIVAYSGYVAFNNSVLCNKALPQLLELLPREQILLESDGPYQFSPTDIPLLNQKLAELLQISAEALSTQIYHNSMEFINAGK